MKLQFPLPGKLESALRQQIGDQKILYSLPYDIDGEAFIDDGFIVVTADAIYKCKGETVLDRWAMTSLSSVAAEKLSLQLYNLHNIHCYFLMYI